MKEKERKKETKKETKKERKKGRERGGGGGKRNIQNERNDKWEFSRDNSEG